MENKEIENGLIINGRMYELLPDDGGSCDECEIYKFCRDRGACPCEFFKFDDSAHFVEI